MSITRNIINLSNQKTQTFIDTFGYYLDSIHELFKIQNKIGLFEKELSALNEDDQNRFKSYLFLMEAVNTTSSGVLNLFANNYYSDAYALLRIMYEVISLMSYGNQSPENSLEIFLTIFKSEKDPKEHSKAEWNLTKKATRNIEEGQPEMKRLKEYINNFGSHISRSKVVLGNLGIINNKQAASVFDNNYDKKEFLMGLDLLYGMLHRTIKEFNIQSIKYMGAQPSVEKEIEDENDFFLLKIRPKLVSLMKKD